MHIGPPIVLEESKQLFAGEETAVVSIETAEGSIGLKLRHPSQVLTKQFHLLLFLRYRQQ